MGYPALRTWMYLDFLLYDNKMLLRKPPNGGQIADSFLFNRKKEAKGTLSWLRKIANQSLGWTRDDTLICLLLDHMVHLKNSNQHLKIEHFYIKTEISSFSWKKKTGRSSQACLPSWQQPAQAALQLSSWNGAGFFRSPQPRLTCSIHSFYLPGCCGLFNMWLLLYPLALPNHKANK